MPISPLVLIIEDEADLVTSLEYKLQKDGFDTRSALCGKDGLKLAHQAPHPDIVILDVMLPDISGKEVCRQLRADPQTQTVPILMLTARGEEIDRIVGFEVGADDYMVKPCSMRELALRLRAILRRSTQPQTSVPDLHMNFGVLRLDVGGHRLWVGEDEVVLTALEFRLLSTFVERKGRVQTRDRLLDDVWGYQAMVTTRTVDTHVKRLREKLGTAGNYIETIRGVGYRLCDVPDKAHP